MTQHPRFGRLLGACLGGAAGFVATLACWNRGVPCLALIGLGVGLGAGLLARSRSVLAALGAGVIGVALPLLYLYLRSTGTLVDLLHRPILAWQVAASGAMAFLLALGPRTRAPGLVVPLTNEGLTHRI